MIKTLPKIPKIQQSLNQQQHLPVFPACLCILITFLNSSHVLTHGMVYPRVTTSIQSVMRPIHCCYTTVRRPIRALGQLSDSQEVYPRVRTPIRQLGALPDSQQVYPCVRTAIRQLGALSDRSSIRVLVLLFDSQEVYPRVSTAIRQLGALSDSQEVYPRVRTLIRQLGGLSACQDCYSTVTGQLKKDGFKMSLMGHGTHGMIYFMLKNDA